MFVILHSSGFYFHNKGRIILFETPQEAENFANMFIQYSTERLMKEGNPMEAMQASIVILNECKIIPADFDINSVECGTVLARELFDKHRR